MARLYARVNYRLPRFLYVKRILKIELHFSCLLSYSNGIGRALLRALPIDTQCQLFPAVCKNKETTGHRI